MSADREARELRSRLRRAERLAGRWRDAWEDLMRRCDAEAKERARSSIEHTRAWYAVRHERLAEWARADLPEELRRQFFNIYANGTKEAHEPPTHAQMLQQAKWRAGQATERREAAEKELARIHALLKEMDEVIPLPGTKYEGREEDIRRCCELMKDLRRHAPTCDEEDGS